MTNSSPSQTTPNRPLESEIAHLFSFALGVVAGFNAAQNNEQRQPFEELPESYSFADGKLDSLAGDSVLRVQRNNWFLIEMKRDIKALKSELDKDRVVHFVNLTNFDFADEESNPILIKAEKAHQFLYLGRPTDRCHPELETLPYLQWVRDVMSDSAMFFAKRYRKPFWSFLKEVSTTPSGFTLEELAEYIHWLNSASEGSGANLSDIGDLIAVAIDSHTGTLDLINSETVTNLVQRYRFQPPQTPGQTGTRYSP